MSKLPGPETFLHGTMLMVHCQAIVMIQIASLFQTIISNRSVIAARIVKDFNEILIKLFPNTPHR